MTTQRPVLGRGLSALIPMSQSAAGARDFVQCPLDHIVLAESQPRKRFDDESLQQLADSIRDKGLLQPVVVARQGEEFRLIAGERRVRAARLAGLASIPAIVRDVASAEAFELALVENIQREDLDALEEAEAYRRLMELRGYTQEQLARRVGKDRSTVANALRLLTLPEHLREALTDGSLSPGHARALLSVEEDAARDVLFREVVEQRLSVRQAEHRARDLKPARGQAAALPRRHALSPLHDAVAADLATRLGTPVHVQPRSGRRGRIVIEYDSLETLQRVRAVCLGEPG